MERFSITYLTSGRDLLRLQVPRESRGEAGGRRGARVWRAGARAPTARARRARRAQVDYSQVFFGPLPGVADEVRALRGLLPQATVPRR